ncbi:hypothetical protein MJG53_006308 [Ovis ammon polii x Ovis aries]|uniref:Uncharacterized protein n=1 Tax=Ovis ammon polii x Ovis aries TaxID=2918886 RepID=A0ACB9V4T4_9CETA|nr:hypothetical protein MJT46_005847 [Ovis ammon polii x Ovis aries]KAI4584774.1 hypothetical protein MJG53_006308 [Ovis ammon polii x Ovis aries]
METRVALMEETGDERTQPGEGKAISIVTPRSSLHPSPDFMEVQHPDPASGKALQSADLPPARGATGPHTPAYHSLSSGRVLFPTPPCCLRFYFSQISKSGVPADCTQQALSPTQFHASPRGKAQVGGLCPFSASTAGDDLRVLHGTGDPELKENGISTAGPVDKSLGAATTEPESMLCNKKSRQNERPTHRNWRLIPVRCN